MRLIRRSGLKITPYDKLAIRLLKVYKGRKKEVFDDIHQVALDYADRQRKFVLFERLEINLIFVLTKLKKRYLRRIRYWHLKKTFLHRGLHALDQMCERRKCDSFIYLLKLYYHAPEAFWEWQNKGGFFKNFIAKFKK